MAPEILGEGVLLVRVEQQIKREMERAERDFERSMDKFERRRAEVSLDANLAPLQKKVAQAEDKVREWQKKVREGAALGIDTKNAERRLREWEKKLGERRTARDEVKLDTAKARKSLEQLQRIERDRAEAAIKYQHAIEDGEKKLADARVDAAERAAREQKAIADKQEREEKARREREQRAAEKATKAEEARKKREAEAAQKAADRKEQAEKNRIAREEAAKQRAAQRDADRAQAALDRDRQNSALLLQDYAKLQRRINSLQRDRRKVPSGLLPSRRASLDLDIRAARQKADEIEQRLKAIGVDQQKFIDIEVRERNTGAIHRLVSGISEASVRLGPFTASVGGAMRALTLLAPIIVSVVGALGSLTAALGSGLLGGIGVLGTTLGGLIPLMGGVVFAMNPLVGSFADALKAQEKLDKAYVKYGKGSKEAKKALEERNETLKNISPAAREAVHGFNSMRNSWKKLTGDTAEQAFGQMVSEGVKTANANIGMFGKQTNTTMRTVRDAFTSAMEGLRTPGATKNLDKFFTRMNNVLPSLLDSFGNLAVAVGRVMLSFSRGKVMGDMVQDFNLWTQSIRDGAEDTDKLNRKVDRMAESFRNVMGFGKALYRVLRNFFSAGVKPGNELLKDMTDGLNDVADAMEEPGKRSELVKFFRDSNSTAKQFWETLKPFLQLFLEWATIMRPVAHALLAIIEPLGDALAIAMDFAPVRALLVGAFTIFLGARLLRGIKNIRGEVGLLARSLRNLKVPGALARFFGGKNKAPKVAPGAGGGGVAGGGGKSAPVVIPPDRDPAVQAVRIVSPIPLPVTIVGGAGGPGGGKGGKGGGGGPVIIPGGGIGPDPKDAPKARGKFRGFLDKVFAGIKKIPGAGALGAALAASFGKIKGLGSKLLAPITGAFKGVGGALGKVFGPIKGAFGKVFGKLGPYFKGTLGRVLGGGLKAIPKLLGKAVPILGWGWLIHDLLPDTPRKWIDDKIKDGFNGVKGAISAAVGGIGDAWGWVKNGASDAWNWVKTAAGDAMGFVKKLVMAPILFQLKVADFVTGKATAVFNWAKGTAVKGAKFALGLADKLKGAASKVMGGVSRVAARGKKFVLGLQDKLKGAASKVMGFVSRVAANGKKFVLGLLDKLRGPARAVMSGVSKVAGAGKKFVLGLLDRLKGPASSVMSGVSKVASTGKKFVLGFLDKLSSAAKSVMSNITSIAAKGASFTISIGTKLIGGAAKLGSKALGLAAKALPDFAQGGSPQMPAFAQGGNATTRNNPQGRASKILNALEAGTRNRPAPSLQAPVGRAHGQVVMRPTYLVGEENRREYVVSTNPTYRGRNKKIVAMAAADLGMNITPAAQGAYSGTFDGSAYLANFNVPNTSGKSAYGFDSKKAKKKRSAQRKRARRGLSPTAVKNPWGKHIQKLMEQQSDLERESSIRESLVSEPEDFVKETKNPDGTVKYEKDQDAINAYTKQIEAVRDTYTALTQVTAEIVQAIPKALKSLMAERQQRKYNIGVLDSEIGREEKRLRTKGNSKKAKDTRDSARARLKKLRPALSDEKRKLGIAKSIYDEFAGETQKEAGFDYREFAIQLNAYNKEIADLGGKAQGQVDEMAADASGGGGGGAGGGDVPLSYGAQAMIADTEKAALLQNYGSNAYTTSPGGGVVNDPAGGGGYQGNPSGLNDPASGSGPMGGMNSSAYSPASGGGSMLRSMAAGSGSGSSFAGSSGAGGGSVAGGAVDNSKTVNVVNNYQTQPDDPHLWSQSVAFDLNTAI